MSLRCLLFSSDDGTAQPIRQALADLGIEGEYCSVAAGTAQKIGSQPFHLVIVDWDDQPDAGVLLQAARERKAAERPLTLAIVDDDASVSQALQAGANSILRRPILPDQMRDTLTKARDLLKAKLEPPPPLAQEVSAAASSAVFTQPASAPPEIRQTLRSEVLHRGSTLSAQFDTESESRKSLNLDNAEVLSSLNDLEPVSGSLDKASGAVEPSSRRSDEPRGLSWYMKGLAGAPPPPAAASSAPALTKPELLTYSNTPNSTKASSTSAGPTAMERAPSPEQRARHERKTETELFAYMSGESSTKSEQHSATGRPWLRTVALLGALAVIGGAAYVTVPRALWMQNLRLLAASVANVSHGWLNPQPVTPVQAPVSHENFGRAGDEYKLPVAENIPDATTDPSQIRVLPVIDPTAKQPNGAAGSGSQAPTPESASAGTSGETSPAGLGVNDQSQPSTPIVVQENQPSPFAPASGTPAGKQPEGTVGQPVNSAAAAGSAKPDPFGAPANKPPTLVIVPTSALPSAPNNLPPSHTSARAGAGIPSSLKSQLASTTPESSGSKQAESAMPSIEPVALPEAAARALLLEQAEPTYPSSAKGRQGTVILQVLIGRDGTVQDSKFLQGSLVFAHVAVDAVKQWRFKPYIMNGRAVSVQTLLTLAFKPAS
jgi:TonB family protein